MNTSPQPGWMTWTGRGLTGLIAAALIASAVMKFVQPGDMPQQVEAMGYSTELIKKIGAVELICVLIYLVPQTAVLGAILLTGYLGGATATHVRLSEGFAGPVVFGVIVWVGLFLRDPRVRALIPFRRSRTTTP